MVPNYKRIQVSLILLLFTITLNAQTVYDDRYGNHKYASNDIFNYITNNSLLKTSDKRYCNIPSNSENWTINDLRTLALHSHGFHIFNRFVSLCFSASQLNAEKNAFTENAIKAQRVLEEFKPKNKTWEEFYNMIEVTHNETINERRELQKKYGKETLSTKPWLAAEIEKLLKAIEYNFNNKVVLDKLLIDYGYYFSYKKDNIYVYKADDLSSLIFYIDNCLQLVIREPRLILDVSKFMIEAEDGYRRGKDDDGLPFYTNSYKGNSNYNRIWYYLDPKKTGSESWFIFCK